MLVNVVYKYLTPEETRTVNRGGATIVHSASPILGADIYAYVNAYSFTDRQPGKNVLLLQEPIVVEPGQFNRAVWAQFDHVFTRFSYLVESYPERFTKINYWRTGEPGMEGDITEDQSEREQKYPLEGRISGICMINGNKSSSVESELYSKRLEVAMWFALNSDIPFDVYGTPFFDLPNYRGAIPKGQKLATLAKYRYCLCFSNCNHPLLSRGDVDEKILDCMEARTIPIYLGAPDITRRFDGSGGYIPMNAFYDFRDFSGTKELETYLHTEIGRPGDEYDGLIKGIDAFVSSGALRAYSWDHLYDQLIKWMEGQTLISTHTRAFPHFIEPADLVFDVGACVGSKADEYIALGAKVVCYEPQPAMAASLRLKYEGQKGSIKVIQEALADNAGERTLSICPKAPTISTLCEEWKTGRFKYYRWTEAATVRTSTIDEQIRLHGRPKFIKIDVEGSELDVLKGMTTPVPYLCFEYACEFISKTRECIQHLVNLGYYGFNFEIGDSQRFMFEDWVTPEGLLAYFETDRTFDLWGDIYAKRSTPATAGKEATMEDNGKTLCLIFSKNRAMQLDATIRSLKEKCKDANTLDVRVLFKTTSKQYRRQYMRIAEDYPDVIFHPEINFKEDVIALLKAYNTVLFCVDDCIFVKEFWIGEARATLYQYNNAIGFSLRLGSNINYAYMTDETQHMTSCIPFPYMDGDNLPATCFDWTRNKADFGYPLEVSSSLYRTADLLPLIEKLDFTSPNTLEAGLAFHAHLFAKEKPCLLCFKQSAAFCNPVNMVQTDYTGNRAGTVVGQSAQYLADHFDQGERIDLTSPNMPVSPASPHQEVLYYFSKTAEPLPITDDHPETSIMILNYNGGENIRMCIESVRRNTPEDYELLVWDNGSTDGFREYLRKGPDITLIESPENIGIAARSHLMAKAKGDFLVFLDNDTVVTKGWLARFLLYGKGFKDCGIIGPRTNYASGYQQVQNINYASIDQLEQVAAAIGGQSRGMLTGISKMPSFCWFFPRAVMEKIGYMRTFGKFGFEDDDFCLRSAIAGFKNVVANDVYIHHTGGPQGRGDATYNQYMLDAWKGFKAVWDIEGNGVIGDGYHPDKIAEREFDPKKHFVAAPKSIQER